MPPSLIVRHRQVPASASMDDDPAGLASTDPAFGLPSFSGTKPITRNNFQ